MHPRTGSGVRPDGLEVAPPEISVPAPSEAPDDARLSLDEVTRLVESHLAPADAPTTARIAEQTAALTLGRPTLVRLVLHEGTGPWEAGGDPLPELTRPGSRTAHWVASQLLPSLPEPARVLARRARDLHPLEPAIADALCGDPTAYDALRAAGVLCATAPGDHRLLPLVASCLGTDAEPEATEAREAWRRAAVCYLEQGRHGPALRAARYADDQALCAQLVEDHGDRVIATGWAGELLAATLPLPPAGASLRARILQGQAARITGEHVLAERILTGVLEDARSWGEPPPADLVWRLALVHYGRGDLKAAVECASGGLLPVPDREPAPDRAMRLATLATALWMSGDAEPAGRAAAEALSAARGADDTALATAQLTQAFLLTGARRHNALSGALAAAERVGDVHLTQRILVNLADALLFDADFPEARDTAQRAIDLFGLTGPAGCYAAALHNHGEALLGTGDLAGARTAFQRSLAVARDRGLERTPMGLWGLAEVEFHAGRLADARVVYEEAVDLARETGERQILVPALSRLATILATDGTPESAVEARAAAEEAVRVSEDDFLADALTALGWGTVALGDLSAAAALAAEAAATARSTGNRRALGPALELAAATAGHPAEAGELLEQALAGYRRSGATLAADRVQVLLGALPGSGHGTAARAAARRLRRAGVRVQPLHPRGSLDGGAVDIRVLGGFEVARDGVPVPASAWRSRQARTLLKLLVARQGRPIGREELCDLLWPEADPAKTGHRLSVLLSTVRGVLDPDRRFPTEHLIAADSQGVRLVLDQVSLDLQEFLEDTAEAARLADDGDDAAARALLGDLLAGYRGEAFEEDPYEAWADEVRDHVRSAWVQSLRLAARLAGRAGDIDAAVTCLVRILAADPYDEPAHRMLLAVLVRARRHGEARRAFDRWLRAMADIGADPPDPDLLAGP